MTAQFEDGKDDGALRTIGEVGQALGLKPHVLRYWEEQFPTLEPLKRSGNRRYYRPSDVALIETINRLVNVEGYTLKGARQAIEEGRAEMSEARGSDDTPTGPDAGARPTDPNDPRRSQGDAATHGDMPELPGIPQAVRGDGARDRAPNSAAARLGSEEPPAERTRIDSATFKAQIVAELKDIREKLVAASTD